MPRDPAPTPSSRAATTAPAAGVAGTGLRVVPVGSRRDLSRFIDLPYELHRRDPQWVPPLRIAERERLDPRRNPFFEYADMQLFLAVQDGVALGRIAAIDDRRHNDVHHENAAAFGFFEAASGDAAAALLAEVEHWARARGRSAVRGPVSPSLNDVCGLLIDGFDSPPSLLTPHNPPEYATFIAEAGYVKAKDLFAWMWDLDKATPERLCRVAERFGARHGITVRTLDLGRFERELAAFRTIYSEGWAGNWGFVAPTENEFAHIAGMLKQVADPEFVLGVEVSGRMVGFAVAVPDINQALRGTNGRLNLHTVYRLLRRRVFIDRLRLLLLGVLPAYRPLGVFPLLVAELVRRGARSPYRRIEGSWVLEDNVDVNRPAQEVGGVCHKTYRLYEKSHL